ASSPSAASTRSSAGCAAASNRAPPRAEKPRDMCARCAASGISLSRPHRPDLMKKAALILLALAAAACGGSTSAPSTVATNATVTTETFTGTLQPGGQKVHTFTVTTPGTVTVTMTQAGPPPTITMGLGIGNPDASGNCIFISGGVTS